VVLGDAGPAQRHPGRPPLAARAPRDPLPSVPGVTELFEAPVQSRPDRRRLGLDVSVERLAAAIRALEAAGASIEHIYDY